MASYVDDIIVISKEADNKVIERLKEEYSLRGVGIPEYYLGGNYHEIEDAELLSKGIRTAISARTYNANSVEKFEKNAWRSYQGVEISNVRGDRIRSQTPPKYWTMIRRRNIGQSLVH
jgi:hypothetical protein